MNCRMFVPVVTVEWLVGNITTDRGDVIDVCRGSNYIATVAEIEARGDSVASSRLLLKDPSGRRFRYHTTGVAWKVPTVDTSL